MTDHIAIHTAGLTKHYGDVHALVDLNLDAARVGHSLAEAVPSAVMEEIAHGERVREYVVEGQVPGNKWRELCRGISIGHKRIQQFDPQEVAAVRLRVTRSAAAPRIRDLSVYHVD